MHGPRADTAVDFDVAGSGFPPCSRSDPDQTPTTGAASAGEIHKSTGNPTQTDVTRQSGTTETGARNTGSRATSASQTRTAFNRQDPIAFGRGQARLNLGSYVSAAAHDQY